MPVLFSDDFNRANNASLGGDWTESEGSWEIDTNRLQSAAPGAGTAATCTCIGHADVADVKVTVTQVNSGGDGGPLARHNGGNNINVGGSNNVRCYNVDVYPSVCEIWRYDPGVGSVLLRTAAITQVANGVMRLEVSGVGATVNIKQFYQGTQRGADVNDTDANRVVVADATGMLTYSSSGTSGGVGDYDDFMVEVSDAALQPGPPFPFSQVMG